MLPIVCHIKKASGGFDLGSETGLSTKNLDTGTSFADSWEIRTVTFQSRGIVWITPGG